MAVDLVEYEDDPAATAAPRRRSGRARRWVAGGLVAVLVVCTLGLLANDEVRADSRFDRSHGALDLTRHRTAVVRSQLDSVRRELDSVDGQVSQNRVALARDTSQLQQARQTLADAQAHASRQAQDVTDLQTCLSGIEQALNALSVNDRAHAIAALDGVAGGCNAAVQADG